MPRERPRTLACPTEAAITQTASAQTVLDRTALAACIEPTLNERQGAGAAGVEHGVFRVAARLARLADVYRAAEPSPVDVAVDGD
jgi:hypothetical protein